MGTISGSVRAARDRHPPPSLPLLKGHRLLSEVACWDLRRPCEAEGGLMVCSLTYTDVMSILFLSKNKRQALLWAELLVSLKGRLKC